MTAEELSTCVFTGSFVVGFGVTNLFVWSATSGDQMEELPLPEVNKQWCGAVHPKFHYMCFAGSSSGVISVFCIDPLQLRGGTRLIHAILPGFHVDRNRTIGRIVFHPQTAIMAFTNHFSGDPLNQRHPPDSLIVTKKDLVKDGGDSFHPFEAEVWAVCENQSDIITSFAFDAYTDGNDIIRSAFSGSMTATIYIVEKSSRTEKRHVFPLDVGHTSPVHDIVFFRVVKRGVLQEDPYYFCSVSMDPCVRIYNGTSTPIVVRIPDSLPGFSRIVPDLIDPHHIFYLRSGDRIQLYKLDLHKRTLLMFIESESLTGYDYKPKSIDWYLRERPLWIQPYHRILGYLSNRVTRPQVAILPLAQDRYPAQPTGRKTMWVDDDSSSADDELTTAFRTQTPVNSPVQSARQGDYGNCGLYSTINQFLLHPVLRRYLHHYYKKISSDVLMQRAGRDKLITTLRRVFDFKFSPDGNASYGDDTLLEPMRDILGLLKCEAWSIPESEPKCRTFEFSWALDTYVLLHTIQTIFSVCFPRGLFRIYTSNLCKEMTKHISTQIAKLVTPSVTEQKLIDPFFSRHPSIWGDENLDDDAFDVAMGLKPYSEQIHEIDSMVKRHQTTWKSQISQAIYECTQLIKSFPADMPIVQRITLLSILRARYVEYDNSQDLFASDDAPPPFIVFMPDTFGSTLPLYLHHSRTNQRYELATVSLGNLAPPHALYGVFDPFRDRGFFIGDPHGTTELIEIKSDDRGVLSVDPAVRYISMIIYHRGADEVDSDEQSIQKNIRTRAKKWATGIFKKQ